MPAFYNYMVNPPNNVFSQIAQSFTPSSSGVVCKRKGILLNGKLGSVAKDASLIFPEKFTA